MLWFGFVGELKKLGAKIKREIAELTSQTLNNRVLIEKLNDKIVGRDEIKLLIENAVYKSQSQAVSSSLKQSHKVKETIETKLINRVRRNKKSFVMAEINKLPPSMSVIEMYDMIVSERGLCSKASFYRYTKEIESLNKSQSQIVRQK